MSHTMTFLPGSSPCSLTALNSSFEEGAEESLQLLDDIVARVCPGDDDFTADEDALQEQFEKLRAALVQKDADVVTCVELGQRLLLENSELKGEISDVWDVVHSQV